jgi:N utilization substance protein A
MASKHTENMLLQETALDKGISNDHLIQALEKAVEKAAIRSFGDDYTFISQYDPQSKKVKLFNRITVVSDEVYDDLYSNDKKYLSLSDAFNEYELVALINKAQEEASKIFGNGNFFPTEIAGTHYAMYEEFLFEDVVMLSCAIAIDEQQLALDETPKVITDLDKDGFDKFLEIKINLPVYYNPIDVKSSKYQKVKERFGDLIPDSAQKYDRIIAQYAKQVLGETLRDIERERTVKEFSVKKGHIVEGTLRITNHRSYNNKSDRQDYYVDINGTEAILPFKEQVPGEFLPYGQTIKMLLLDVVTSEQKAPQIIVSRRNEKFIEKLLEEQVSEIMAGDVVIKGLAREAGVRTKIAVTSKDRNIDPIGACLGSQGNRIRPVLDEISRYMPKGNEREREKIEIILYKEDPAKFVKNAIQPSILDDRHNVITRYYMNDTLSKMILVIPERYLKQMIGKKGQNVRLASRLTGWNIDIFSEETYLANERKLKQRFCDQPGINPDYIDDLWELSIDTQDGTETFRSLENIMSLSINELSNYLNISPKDAKLILDAAQSLIEEDQANELAHEKATNQDDQE